MNKSIAKAATVEFTNLAILFLAQLCRFIVFSQSSEKEITAEKVDKLLRSGDRMLLNFQKDDDRIRNLINRILELEFTEKESLRLDYIFSNFKTTLLNVDPNDSQGSWNFFDSGLDILIEDVTRLISTKEVTNPVFHFDFGGPTPILLQNSNAAYLQA